MREPCDAHHTKNPRHRSYSLDTVTFLRLKVQMVTAVKRLARIYRDRKKGSCFIIKDHEQMTRVRALAGE
jgi:hypothetical protein